MFKLTLPPGVATSNGLAISQSVVLIWNAPENDQEHLKSQKLGGWRGSMGEKRGQSTLRIFF